MKRTLHYFTAFALACALLTYSGCKPHHDNPVPVTDTQITALSKTWKIVSATRDDTDQTSYYTGFALKLSGTLGTQIVSYDATVGTRPALSVWPKTGTFTFDATTPTTNMVRDSATDPVAVVYSVSATQLIIHFTYSGAGYSRTNDVTGAWVFTFGL